MFRQSPSMPAKSVVRSKELGTVVAVLAAIAAIA
jgi:hypothetical protein